MSEDIQVPKIENEREMHAWFHYVLEEGIEAFSKNRVFNKPEFEQEYAFFIAQYKDIKGIRDNINKIGELVSYCDNIISGSSSLEKTISDASATGKSIVMDDFLSNYTVSEVITNHFFSNLKLRVDAINSHIANLDIRNKDMDYEPSNFRERLNPSFEGIAKDNQIIHYKQALRHIYIQTDEIMGCKGARFFREFKKLQKGLNDGKYVHLGHDESNNPVCAVFDPSMLIFRKIGYNPEIYISDQKYLPR